MSSTASKAGWFITALFLLPGAQAISGQNTISQREIQAGELFRASKYKQAETIYHGERMAAARRGDSKAYLRLTSNLAGCRQAQFDLRGAVKMYEEVRSLALQRGEWEIAGVALINLSSVFSSQWEPDASDASIQEAARYLGPTSRFYPMLKAQESAMHARRLNHEAALLAAREAAAAADARGDHSLVAQVWDRLGLLFLALNRLDEAQIYLNEAFRMRRLQRLPLLESSYRSLARLRLAQRRPAEALVLIQAADLARATAPARGAPWVWEADKAAVLAANGESRLARQAYSASIARARAWRSAILPMHSSVLASEVTASQIAEDYAVLLASAASTGAARQLAQQSLAVLETARAEAFHSDRINAAWRKQILGPEYARALSSLRRAELELLVRRSPAAVIEARKQRGEVARLEALIGVQQSDGPGHPAASSFIPAVSPDEAAISFKLGPQRSWIWIMTSAGVRVATLPPAAEITSLTSHLRRAIASGGDWLTPASSLHDALFSKLTPSEAAKRHWRLSLDGPLFEIPFAALARPTVSGRSPLVLHHTFTIVPSLFSPGGAPAPKPLQGRFVGVGDALYNLADARMPPPVRLRRPRYPWFSISVAASGDAAEWDLPRIPGSAIEIRSAATVLRRAGVDCRILTGGQVSIESIEKELIRPPAVLHFAAHVLATPDSGSAVALSRASALAGSRFAKPGEVFIALGHGSGGSVQMLSSTGVVSRLRATGSLVVLSGCGSAQGAALPGAGLQGMTRAWLAVQASSVIGSLWSQPDSADRFFGVFYSSLAQGVRLRSALQAAQTAMFHSPDWRNQPRYWAGWILVGQEN